MTVRSAVVAVGDELLLGDIVNTNAAWLGERLAAAGCPVVHASAVGDDVDRLVTALRRALEDADVVLVTGGLGPTVDDLTRDAVAAVAGVPLERQPHLEQSLRDRFAAFGYAMPEAVLRQADVPRGARVLDNPVGTAPGLRLELPEGRVLYALPGPPHELAATVEPVLAELALRSGEHVVTRTLRCAGIGESNAAELVEGVLAELPPGVQLAYLAGGGIVRVRLTTSAATVEAAQAVLDPLVERAAAALGEHVSGRDDETLPQVVVRLLREAGATLAVAESLTAGLLGATVTEVPGASAVFRGGVQVYATDLKETLAGVPGPLLGAHGPVSAQTAGAMAAGVRERLGATYGLALTGVAGPDEQDGQPVGTVHVAVAGPRGGQVRSVRLPGDRERVRVLAVATALDLLRRELQAGSASRADG